jgi:hypothetical protein
MAILEAGFDDATAVLALPEPYRRRLRTSNGMERRERGGAPPRARHPHLPQSGIGHPPAGRGAHGTARAVDDGPPLLRHGRVLAVAPGPRRGTHPRGGHDADGVREAAKQSIGVANFQRTLDATHAAAVLKFVLFPTVMSRAAEVMGASGVPIRSPVRDCFPCPDRAIATMCCLLVLTRCRHTRSHRQRVSISCLLHAPTYRSSTLLRYRRWKPLLEAAFSSIAGDSPGWL